MSVMGYSARWPSTIAGTTAIAATPSNSNARLFTMPTPCVRRASGFILRQTSGAPKHHHDRGDGDTIDPHAVARPDSARPPVVHGRGREPPTTGRVVAHPRRRVRSWLGSRTAPARRRGSRDRTSCRLDLLARLRGALGHDDLHATRSPCAPPANT